MEERRRILWLKSALPWPLDQGTNFIAYNLFTLLRERHDIVYTALRRGPSDDAAIEALQKIVTVETLDRPNTKSATHRALYAAALRIRRAVAWLPPEVFYELPGRYRRRVRERLETGGFDLLFLHYWFLGELGPWLADHHAAALLHDNETDRLELEAKTVTDPAAKRELTRRAEASAKGHLRLVERVRHVFFYTEADRDSFFRRAGRDYGNVHVFPYFYRFGEVPDVDRIPNTVVFTGKMSYLPNVVAATRMAEDIWPLVRRRAPDARLLLAGRDPGPEVKRLAAVPGVEVTGFVEDMRSLVKSAAVYVAPVTIGSGLKIKLMEAGELSAPIVATKFAVSGFDFLADRDYLRAETDGEFAEAILGLLADPDAADSLGAAGREGIRRRFAGDEVKARTLALFDALTRGEDPPTP